MRVVTMGLALALCGCSTKIEWTTKDGEDGMMLVREYYEPDQVAPTWVLRIDMTKAHPTSHHLQWKGDALTLELGTANGTVEDRLFCYGFRHSFSCNTQKFDFAGGDVITVKLDEAGQIDHYVQSDYLDYTKLR